MAALPVLKVPKETQRLEDTHVHVGFTCIHFFSLYMNFEFLLNLYKEMYSTSLQHGTCAVYDPADQ